MEQKHQLEFSRIRNIEVAAMSDSEDKAEPTAVKAEGEKEDRKNGDAKPKAEADVKKSGDDAGEAKEEPDAKAEKKEEGDGVDGKEDSKKVTAAELRKLITAILKEADLEKTSAKKVGKSIGRGEGDDVVEIFGVYYVLHQF